MDYCKSTSGFCYSSTWKGVLRRGCVGDNVVENVPRCEEDEDNCSICSDKNLCNDLKVEKKKCHRLDGRTRDLIDCPYSMRSSGLLNGCYHVVNETTHEVKKGCLNSLSIEEKVKLFANSREYKMCYTSGCNSKDYFPKCMECTDNSKKCLAPDVIGSKRYCSKLTDICMTSVKNGYVERRCADSIDMASYCEPEDPKCDTCSDGVLCNIRAVVNTCKRCDSISQCKEYNNPIQPCSLKYAGHSNFSECYVKIEKDQVTAKGCFNDLTKADQDKCRKGDDDCQICSGTNCNSKSKFKQECYSCDGSKDSKCANSGNETTIQCPNYSSSCFVGVDAKGITHRGCSSNEDDDKKYTREYELCYKDKCNDYPSPHNQLHCYQCDGDENCENIFIADDTTSIASTACANNNKNENKCFAYVTNGMIIDFFQCLSFILY